MNSDDLLEPCAEASDACNDSVHKQKREREVGSDEQVRLRGQRCLQGECIDTN
jgi:hypothetical protein